jgi:TetR/AcrR family transcriptional regulator
MSQKLSTKDLILRAAEAEFAAHGLGGARVETIASRARVNNALPFYHFGSKTELYEAVIERIMTRMEDLFNRTVATYPDFEDRLSAFVRGLTGYLSDNPNWLRIVLRELLDNSPRVPSIVHRHLKPLVERAQKELAREIRAGHLRAIDPMQIMISGVGEVVSYFLAAPLLEGLGQRQPLSKANLATRQAVVIEILLRGVRTARNVSLATRGWVA